MAAAGRPFFTKYRTIMEKFIVAAETALRISDSQQGDTTLVLLHGYLESLEVWEDFTKLLTPYYRVIAIDIPGHGISEVRGEVHSMEFVADVLKGVLDKQGVARCFVAGHSMGGYVAEAFAARYPEMLQGLILFHSTPNADTDAKKEDRRREIELIRSDKKELIASLSLRRFCRGEPQTASRADRTTAGADLVDRRRRHCGAAERDDRP